MRPPIPNLDTFGEPFGPDELRTWRNSRRFTQDDLAQVLRVTRVTVANWEGARTEVPTYLHLALESIDRRLSFAAPPKGTRGSSAL